MKRNLQSTFNLRQHMLSEDFEIFYYSDTHLNGVKKHSHDYYEFYLFLEGNISMFINNQSFTLKTGDLILIPPGISHYLVNHDENTPYRRFVFWISRNYYTHLTTLSDDYSYIVSEAIQKQHYIYHNDLATFNSLQARLFQLVEELHAQRYGHTTRIYLCVDDLMLHMNRIAYETKHPSPLYKDHSLYEFLMVYIENHLTEELSLNHLAEIFYVSKYHISHIFKENMGIPVHQYIIKKRLAMCRDALLSNSNISNTFSMYGFKDYSSFYRAFKKEYGLSPKEYKELHMHILP